MAVRAVEALVNAINHDAETNPYAFCGFTDTTPLIRAAMGVVTFVVSMVAAAVLTGQLGEGN